MIRIPLASLLLALPAAAMQGEEAQLVSYDLGRVLPRWDEGDSWSQSLVLPPLSHPHEQGSRIAAERYGGLASFELLDLLNQILGDELRREGREMLVEGGSLSVLAPAALQQQVRALLEGLEQALAGAATLRLDFLPLAEGAPEPATLLGEDEAQKLVAAAGAGGAARSLTVELSAGRTAVLEAGRSVPFLFDFDVEIAQGVAVFVPVMAETSTGLRLAVRASAAPGGTALALLVQSSELRALRTLGLDIEGTVTLTDKPPYKIQGPELLQAPEVDLVSFACDTFLPDGKALAFTFESVLAGKKSRQLLLLRRPAGTLSSYLVRAIPGSNRSLVVLDSGLFRGPRFTTEVGLAHEHTTAGLHSPRVDSALSFETSGFLIDWLKARFSIWRPFGPWILIVTDPAWDRDAAAQLDRLVKGLKPRTALTEASLTLALGSTRPVRARLPILEGSQAGLVVGYGRTSITGYSAEVAQSAAVHDPNVGALFDGLACSLSTRGDVAELRGLAQLTSSGGFLKAGSAGFGALERIEAQTLRFDERWKLGEGRTLRFGPSQDKGEAGGPTLELTLTPLAR